MSNLNIPYYGGIRNGKKIQANKDDFYSRRA